MSDFNPGHGWREVDEMTAREASSGSLWLFDEKGDSITAWVRETPVPPLPTEPYTVIRVDWIRPQHGGSVEATLHTDGWHFRDGQIDAPYVVEHNITGFEILSEPRAVTAKAVLDRFRVILGLAGENPDHEMFALEDIAREFGVTDD